jgi:hypothetical protein
MTKAKKYPPYTTRAMDISIIVTLVIIGLMIVIGRIYG